MMMLVRPVLPLASRTVAASVCQPFGTAGHASLTGPGVDVVMLLLASPSTLRVNVFAAPVAPSTRSSADPLGLTKAQLLGSVMYTRSGPPAGGTGLAGGDAGPLPTTTALLVVAVRPAASRTVTEIV